MKRRRIGAALAATLALVAAASASASATADQTTSEEDHGMLPIEQEEYHQWDADEHYDYDYNDPYNYNDLNQDDEEATDADDDKWDNQLEWDSEASGSSYIRGNPVDHTGETEEMWINDQELDQILAAINLDKATVPLMSLEAQIEIVLQQRFQQRQQEKEQAESLSSELEEEGISWGYIDDDEDDELLADSWDEFDNEHEALEVVNSSEPNPPSTAILKGEVTKEDRGLRKKKKNDGQGNTQNQNNNRPSTGRGQTNNNKKKKAGNNNNRPDTGRGQGNNNKKKKAGNNNNRPNRGQNNNNKMPKNNRPNNKRGQIKNNKFGNEQLNNRQFKNICLDPPDQYRTCFARAIDPSNDVTGCDTIARNSYNLGAQLHKKNRPIPEGIPEPYTPPYIVTERDVIEARSDGKMHISLFEVNQKVACDDLIAIEETTLEYLNANVGSSDTFRPACAYVDENAINTQVQRDANGRVRSVTAMRLEVIYTSTQSFQQQLDKAHNKIRKERIDERRRLSGRGLRHYSERDLQATPRCDSSNHHLCCSQTSINADVGAFCRNLGCDFSTCGGRGLAVSRPPGRPQRPGGGTPNRPGVGGSSSGGATGGRPSRPNRPNRPSRPSRPGRPSRPNSRRRSMLSSLASFFGYGDLLLNRHLQNNDCTANGYEDSDFTQTVRRMTSFTTSKLTRSLLNDTDTNLVAQCSTNWYVITRGDGIPTVTCDQFDDQQCVDNQDLEFQTDEVHCLEPSSMPSASPTLVPSVSSIPSVSSAPSQMPS